MRYITRGKTLIIYKDDIVNFTDYIYADNAFSIYKNTEMTMPASYSLIKGALDNFTRYLATYYAAYNIRANIVCPGGIYNNQDKKFKENYEKLIPLGRMAIPEDIVGAIVFLASDSSSYITGQTFMIDGGLSAW